MTPASKECSEVVSGSPACDIPSEIKRSIVDRSPSSA